MTPEEQAYLLSMLKKKSGAAISAHEFTNMGNDVDAGIFNDPEYKFRNMRTPDSVVDPKTGQYLGEYEMMPQSLLGSNPASAPAIQGNMQTIPSGNNLGGVTTNQGMRMIEQNMVNSGNQIIDQSRLNLGALLRRLGMQ